jgi:uncharacterized protein
MGLGLLLLHLEIPGCRSLKEKRSRIKPLLARLHKEFNVSTAELDRQDVWQEAVIGCALLSSDARHTQRSLQAIVPWIEQQWPDLTIISEKIEIQ